MKTHYPLFRYEIPLALKMYLNMRKPASTAKRFLHDIRIAVYDSTKSALSQNFHFFHSLIHLIFVGSIYKCAQSVGNHIT